MSKSPLKQMNPNYVEHGPDKENKTTILGKDPKGGASKAYANSSIFSGDWDGDKNISGGELAAEAGMALIGSGLAKNALKKIAGKTSVIRYRNSLIIISTQPQVKKQINKQKH